MSIEFHCFDDAFRVSSWEWLNDPEIKEMTDSPTITEENQKEWFKSLNSRDDYKIWGVIYNDKRIGVVGIKKIDFERKEGEYFGYIGDKTYWGKGIGKSMIEFSIKEARKLILKKIVLHVIPWNERAIKLYEKNGFVLNVRQSTKDNLLYEYKISNI